ncbi:MAG TPA: DUF3667 domain-containing protein [Flavobacterium sp.]|jgi:uncharacterized membrane protein YvlD (DUF360 family)
MTTTTCLNCDNGFLGNFCPDCGQKAKTGKIDINYVQEEAKYTLLHLNNGFLYTTKQMLTRPGFAIREFIDGKRVRHYKPLLYLFVMAGLYGFLLHYFVDFKEMMNIDESTAVSGDVNGTELLLKGLDWMAAHYSIVEVIYLPIIALSSYLAFRKWGYNFIEHLIINAYAGGLRLAVSILTFPLIYLTAGTTWSMLLTSVISVITMVMTGWLYLQFFKDKPLDQAILRAILAIAYIFIISLLIGIAFGIIYIVMFIKY